jgi:hypothetical protein
MGRMSEIGLIHKIVAVYKFVNFISLRNTYQSEIYLKKRFRFQSNPKGGGVM